MTDTNVFQLNFLRSAWLARARDGANPVHDPPFHFLGGLMNGAFTTPPAGCPSGTEPRIPTFATSSGRGHLPLSL